MIYPLLSEYIDAILTPEDSFEELKGLHPVLDDSGRPVMSSGNFAVVFKMEDSDGRKYALKCFLKDQERRTTNYMHITRRLNGVRSPYIVNVNYYEKELFVDSRNSGQEEFPVLLMDWVDGLTLNEYIRQNIDSEFRIKYLAYSFSRMARWLLEQDFAHGDIKPDNILVKQDGSITLVDYDGMYVPEMGHVYGTEIGSPGFRHPLRKLSDFGPRMDDFSLIVILFSIIVISNYPKLWSDQRNYDGLLFTEDDFGDILGNFVISQVYPSDDKEVNFIFSLLLYALSQKTLEGIEPEKIEIRNPIHSIIDRYNNGKKLRFPNGLIYSWDMKCLLSGTESTSTSVVIHPDTLFIADNAFDGNKFITTLSLPDGLLSIGYSAFNGCSNLKEVFIPGSLLEMGYRVFNRCESLQTVESPYFDTTNHCLSLHGRLIAVISKESIEEYSIPKYIFTIDPCAFSFCNHIYTLRLNNISIGGMSFEGASIHRLIHENVSPDGHCIIINKELKYFVAESQIEYQIPDNVDKIGKFAFIRNNHLKSVYFSPSIKSTGLNSFSGCENLQEVVLSNSLKEIGCLCFSDCKSLRSIYIPDSVTSMDAGVFYGCDSLRKVTLSSSLKKLDNNSFYKCKSLETIQLPNSLEIINKEAFAYCNSLTQVEFGESLEEIQHDAFKNCERLTELKFKSSGVKIHPTAFKGCDSITKVWIPMGTTTDFKQSEAFDSVVSFFEY